jgi:hypothetical protein
MGFLRKIILLSAFVLLTLSGYFYFVSSEAPNFFLWGDLKNNAIIFFLAGGILIFVGIVSGIISKSEKCSVHI